ncbi:N-acetylmuramoyl-L-alanine amidase family protein [Maribacter sp. 2-571]|uniref:N-acetylmuramoyl-L-alanine amidase family protein n=1 Tax=Maribacter sp. 2-571 TaxID=3417569 RepID=UPI003D34FAE4
MKNLLKNVSLVILLLKMCYVFGQEVDFKKIIVIDPGHGGKDSGAIGIKGIREKDVVLQVAREILKLNEELENPHAIYLTRYNDTLISLSDRTQLVKALKVDLFISLHCNHSDNPNARGVEVFVTNQQSDYAEDLVWLAYKLQAALNKQLGFESRGVKFANFHMLRETAGFVPGMLLELGFLSNGDENEYLLKHKSMEALALVIWDSLIENLGSYERVGD